MDATRRFAFCRALYEVVRNSEPGPAVVSCSNTIAQKQNRAFAAELLAPAEALRDRLFEWDGGDDEISEVANEFGVSDWVIRHQVQNHHIGAVATA